MVGSSNSITDYVPLDNMKALIDATFEFGRYPIELAEGGVKGTVWKYGENINTDVIFPGKYTYTIQDPTEMAQHAMEDLDPEFSKNVKKGDIIVAGTNFGCGSSREQAATCLKYAGVSAIIAKSFSRIFFRTLNGTGSGLKARIDFL